MTPVGLKPKGPTAPAWRRRLVGLLTVSLFAAACSNSSPAADPTTTADSPTTSAPATTAGSTTSTSITTTTTVAPLEEELLAAWDGFWEAWTTVRASEDLDPGPLQEVASPDVVAGAVALFERQRESGLDPVETEVVTHAKVTNTESDQAVIEDCVLLSPSFTESAGVWYEADMRISGSSWLVADLRIRSVGGCVPAEMAADAIAGYEAYYDAVNEFWDPPDPGHPLISDVLAEPRLSNVISLLEEHEARGVAFRTSPITHAEVIEVRSATELVILDCYEPDPADGLYDLATGERLPDEPTIREGQRNLRSAVMVFENGRWKSSDFQGQVDFACEFAPTERGLPSV